MSKLKKKEFTIGLVVIIALLILIFGIDYLKGINLFKPSNYYVIEYENVSGLETAAAVRIDGYKVGQVREINFPYDKPGKIEVLIAVDSKLHIPENSTANIDAGIINSSSININLGNSTKMLPVGGKIKALEGTDLLSSLSDELMPQINGILPKVDSLLYNLNLLVSDPALMASIQRLDGITTNVFTASRGLDYTLNSQVPMIMRNAGGITVKLDSVTGGLADLSNRLRMLPLEPTMANVERVTADLADFSRKLNDKNSTLGLLTSDPALYNRINQVSADIDSLIVDIKRNPKRYISIKLL